MDGFIQLESTAFRSPTEEQFILYVPSCCFEFVCVEVGGRISNVESCFHASFQWVHRNVSDIPFASYQIIKPYGRARLKRCFGVQGGFGFFAIDQMSEASLFTCGFRLPDVVLNAHGGHAFESSFSSGCGDRCCGLTHDILSVGLDCFCS